MPLAPAARATGRLAAGRVHAAPAARRQPRRRCCRRSCPGGAAGWWVPRGDSRGPQPRTAAGARCRWGWRCGWGRARPRRSRGQRPRFLHPTRATPPLRLPRAAPAAPVQHPCMFSMHVSLEMRPDGHPDRSFHLPGHLSMHCGVTQFGFGLNGRPCMTASPDPRGPACGGWGVQCHRTVSVARAACAPPVRMARIRGRVRTQEAIGPTTCEAHTRVPYG